MRSLSELLAKVLGNDHDNSWWCDLHTRRNAKCGAKPEERTPGYCTSCNMPRPINMGIISETSKALEQFWKETILQEQVEAEGAFSKFAGLEPEPAQEPEDARYNDTPEAGDEGCSCGGDGKL